MNHEQRATNFLIIAQKVDENDDHRGFFIEWLKEFARKFDEVNVITLAEGSHKLPANVHIYSLGKERGTSKFLQAIRFYRYIVRLMPRSNGVFAHASPIFVIASWPVAFILRKKIILWYLHRSVTLKLRLAEKLCYKIVTAAKESLKFRSAKIVETGHGINIDKFTIDRNWSSGESLKILSVGRISKIKNYGTLVEAAKILKDSGLDFKIKIIGKPVMSGDDEYLESLQLLIANYRLQNMIHFVGFVSYGDIATYYQNSDIVVGLTPDGGIDKAILEGMASGCMIVTSNNACRKYFGEYADKLICKYNDSENLAEKIAELNVLVPEDKKLISDFMVKSVAKHHALENLINQIVQVLG